MPTQVLQWHRALGKYPEACRSRGPMNPTVRPTSGHERSNSLGRQFLTFLQHLVDRGLKGVRLIKTFTEDAIAEGLVKSAMERAGLRGAMTPDVK